MLVRPLLYCCLLPVLASLDSGGNLVPCAVCTPSRATPTGRIDAKLVPFPLGVLYL